MATMHSGACDAKVVEELERQQIPVRGVLKTAKGTIIYVIKNCLCLENELINLLDNDALTEEGISNLCDEIRRNACHGDVA